MKSLVSAAVQSGSGSWTPRRPLVRFLGLAPAALLLCGLFTVWAGPAARPVSAGTALAQPQSVAVSGDWTQFRNDPTRQGYNAAETTLSASNVHALGTAWTAIIGNAIYSSPAVANGVVYIGSYDGKLYAFAVGCNSGGGSCSPLWTATTGSAIQSSPAVANGVVYVGSEDDKLYAYAVGCASGGGSCSPLWTGATGGAIDYSSPVVSNGVVYVGSSDGELYAFNAAGVSGCSGSPKTCSPLWTGFTGGDIESSPAVANGVVYVGSYDGKLYAYAVGCNSGGGSCSPLWTATTGGSIFSSPAVANGVVYVGSYDHKLYAFAVGCNSGGGSCSPLWTATTGSAIHSSPAVANGVVYVGSYDDKLYAYAVGCNSGGGSCTPLWTATTGGGILSSPAVANGVVYVGSYDDSLYAFDATGVSGCSGSPKTCTPLWTAATSGLILSSPAVANGVVYVGSFDDTLHAFHLVVVRYAGADRFATAAAVSAHTFGSPCHCTAYIATAYNFPDALAGAAAAGTIKGPVLFVAPSGAIDSYTATELLRLKPDHIVVLGGTGVISAAVFSALAAYAPAGQTVRYAGADRFATAAAVSAHTFGANCACTAYVATAYNFPDALAGAAAAGTRPGPVLLVNATGAINAATKAELVRLKPAHIVVLGGTGVVSAAVYNLLKAYAPAGQIARYAGSDRYGTAGSISAHTFAASCGCSVYVSAGTDFNGALAAAAAAGTLRGPLLLVATTGAIPAATATELTRLKPAQIIVVGNTSEVSAAVYNLLAAYVP